MPVDTQTISLKGESPVWSGLVDFSEVAPSAGMFTTLRGVVVGKDGTELERFPGTVKAGTPFLGEGITPTGFTNHSATDTTFIFQRPFSGGSTRGHGLEFTSGTTTSTIWLNIVYNNGTTFVRLTAKHTAIITGSHTLRVNGLDSSTWTAIQPESVIFVSRDNGTPHGLIWAGDVPCVVAESVYHQRHSGKNGVGPKRSIATWVGDGPLDWEDNDFFPGTAKIDNTPRFEYWPNPANGQPLDVSNNNGNSFPLAYFTYETFPVLFDFAPRRKANLHVANDDIILAVPGFGVMLTVPLSGRGHPGIAKWTRLLGIPKGGMGRWAWAGNSVPGHEGFLASDKFWLSVGYRNRLTGEVGLPSKPIQFDASDRPGTGGYFLTLFVDMPRNMIAESAGLSVVIYTSGINGQETAGFEPVYEEVLGANQCTYRIRAQRTWFEYTTTRGPNDPPRSWEQLPSFPRIEQMPRGASCAITARGITFSAGAIGYVSSLTEEKIYVSAGWNGLVKNDKFFAVEEPDPGVFGQLAAGRRLPSSYQGIEARVPISQRSGNTIYDTRVNKALIDLLIEHVDNTVNYRLHPYSIINAIFEKSFQNVRTHIDVEMPRGRIQHSEPGHAGVNPSINELLIDLVEGEDIRGMARIGDSLILCTEEETYSLSWGRSPLGAHPRILSNNFGCIAPNAMVDFPGGVAWLSREGPVISDGGPPAWVGATIANFWDTLERDSNGLMWQACGVYDQENKRIIWGVRSGVTTTASGHGAQLDGNPVDPVNVHSEDDKFSTLPNDTLLVMNIESGAFSIEELPAGQEVVDLERMPDADGEWRVFALEEDNNIWQLDDRMTEHAQSTDTHVASGVGAPGAAIFNSATITAGGIKSGEKLLIRDTDGEIVWQGTASADSSATFVPVTPATDGYAATDTLETKLKVMVMETTFKAFEGWNRLSTVRSVGIVHTVENKNPTSTTDYSYARVTLTDDAGNAHVMGLTWGQRLINHFCLFESGYAEARGTRLKVEIIGNAHVAVKDILVEVGGGG